MNTSIWKNPIHFLAFGLGMGTSPVMPGTMGTLLAVPLYLILQPLPFIFYLAITITMLLLGIYICGVTAKDIGVPDHSGIVWDEIVGYLITMTFAPTGWIWVILGFCLFRFFDIIKPWPINWIDRTFKNGTGMMMDDVLAGVYAGIIIGIVAMLFVG